MVGAIQPTSKISASIYRFVINAFIIFHQHWMFHIQTHNRLKSFLPLRSGQSVSPKPPKAHLTTKNPAPSMVGALVSSPLKKRLGRASAILIIKSTTKKTSGRLFHAVEWGDSRSGRLFLPGRAKRHRHTNKQVNVFKSLQVHHRIYKEMYLFINMRVINRYMHLGPPKYPGTWALYGPVKLVLSNYFQV